MAAKGDTEQPAAVETQGRLAVAASSVDKLGLQTNAGCGWVGVMRRRQGQHVWTWARVRQSCCRTHHPPGAMNSPPSEIEPCRSRNQQEASSFILAAGRWEYAVLDMG